MHDVCDRIFITWGRMFRDSEGPLKIRHLKTAYGDFVDLEERVVGDLFDERGADGNIRNSILEVHRYPPRPDELNILQRYSSLAPNSSARPRKRPLELPSPSYPSQNSRNIHDEIPSIEERDPETNRLSGAAIKRQRTYESVLNKTFDAHEPLRVREEQRGGLYHSSQTSGTQKSLHQVLDSQKSPGKKRTSWLAHLSIALLTFLAELNPYGTPTSLSLIGPQESIPCNEIDLSTIPDSPLGRETSSVSGASGGAIQLDRESTKSESPELRGSVHEVTPANPIDASGEQLSASAKSPEPSTTSFIFNSASQPVSIPQIVDEYAKHHGLRAMRTQIKAADVNRTSKRRSPTVDPAHAHNVRSNSEILRKSDPIFDPIESDTESFRGKQQMQSAKRLKSSKTPTASFTSPLVSNKAGADRRDGHFLMPSVPHPRTNGAGISLSEVTSPGQCENTRKSLRDPKDANMSIQIDQKRHGNNVADSLDQTQSEPCDNDRTNIGWETPKMNAVYQDIADTVQTSAQAITAWSQDPNKCSDGTGQLSVQQRDNLASSQDQEPDETTRLGHDANGVVRNPNYNRFDQEAERLAEEAEGQQEKRIREKKAEEKRSAREAMEEQNAAKLEATERKTNEERLVDEKGAKEEEARAEDLTQAKKANAKKELAEAKRIEETRANAARLAEEKETSE
ncbi:MAG: hypothetical protein Q9175_004580, partial [Cornicularia normoerica]